MRKVQLSLLKSIFKLFIPMGFPMLLRLERPRASTNQEPEKSKSSRSQILASESLADGAHSACHSTSSLHVARQCLFQSTLRDRSIIQITETTPHTWCPITILPSFPLQPRTSTSQFHSSSRRQWSSRPLSLCSLQRLWTSCGGRC